MGQILWTAIGLLLVGTLLWMVFLGGRTSVRGEEATGEQPVASEEQVVADGLLSDVVERPVAASEVTEEVQPVPGSESDVQPDVPQGTPIEEPATGSPADPIDLAPEVVRSPPDVVVREPFGSGLLSDSERMAAEPIGGSDPVVAERGADPAGPGPRAEFLTALEIFRQEGAGYEERRAAFERGLVGCNALNSWYRSVGDAFVRLSRKVTEAGPATASAWTAEYDSARASMDEIDRHYLATECPLPR